MRAHAALTVSFVVAAVAGLALSRSSWSMPDAIRIPIANPDAPGHPPNRALFRHSTHGQFQCYACHPTLFPKDRVGFTHAQMEGGRLCARCHDGESAFSATGPDCERCHAP